MRTPRRGRLALLLALLGLSGGFVVTGRASPPVLDFFTVEPTYFSPDGDGKRDSVRYSFTLAGSRSWVVVSVRADSAGQPGPLRRTLVADSLAAGVHRFTWDGKDDGGSIADGIYWLLCQAGNAEGSDTLPPARVVLDRVAPAVSVLQVDNPYTPDLPEREPLATVRLRVWQIGEKDRLTLRFLRREPPVVVDSSYSVVLDTVARDASGEFDARVDLSELPDGMYGVRATARDEAEHSAVAFGPDLDVDVTAPAENLSEPQAQYRNSPLTEVRGTVKDRNSLSLLVVRVSSAGGAVEDSICRPLAPCLADSTSYTVLVPDSIGKRDTVTILVSARDLPGHFRAVTHLVFVDTIPPPPPAIDPGSVPQRVGRPALDNVSGTAGGGAELVIFYLDGDSVGTAQVNGGGFERDLAFAGLGLGEHVLTARSRDPAGNRSNASAPATFVYEEKLGVDVPERFRAGDIIQVNLAGPGRKVSAFIYTLHGKLVRALEAGPASSPYYELRWDLRDTDNQMVGNGPYVLRVIAEQADGSRLEKRVAMVVVK